jgi:hypothetical protein
METLRLFAATIVCGCFPKIRQRRRSSLSMELVTYAAGRVLFWRTGASSRSSTGNHDSPAAKTICTAAASSAVFTAPTCGLGTQNSEL